MRGRRDLALAGLLSPLFSLLLACAPNEPAPQPTPVPLETVDVEPAPDASASLAAEPVEVRRDVAGGFSGVLPEGFPADVPVLRPSSLVDVEIGPDGAVTIELASPAAASTAGSAYARLLAGAGWSLAGGGESGRGTWRKGSRTLRVESKDTRPGCRMRISIGSR